MPKSPRRRRAGDELATDIWVANRIASSEVIPVGIFEGVPGSWADNSSSLSATSGDSGEWRRPHLKERRRAYRAALARSALRSALTPSIKRHDTDRRVGLRPPALDSNVLPDAIRNAGRRGACRSSGLRAADPGSWRSLGRATRSHVSLLHFSWTEGFPQVLLEAFAAGLPVVATGVGAVAAGAARLVDPGDAATAARESTSLLPTPCCAMTSPNADSSASEA